MTLSTRTLIGTCTATILLSSATPVTGQISTADLERQYQQTCSNPHPAFAATCPFLRQQIDELRRSERQPKSEPPAAAFRAPSRTNQAPTPAPPKANQTSPTTNAAPQMEHFGIINFGNDAQLAHWAQHCQNRSFPAGSDQANNCRADFSTIHRLSGGIRVTGPTAASNPTPEHPAFRSGGPPTPTGKGGRQAPANQSQGGQKSLINAQGHSCVVYKNTVLSDTSYYYNYEVYAENKCGRGVTVDWETDSGQTGAFVMPTGGHGRMTCSFNRQKGIGCRDVRVSEPY